MPDSPQPSEWFLAQFGEHSLEVMSAFVAAANRAHERSLEAKAGSELRTDDAYGTYWLSLREEVVSHLAFLPGLQTIRPSRARYLLPVFNGKVIFSAKCPAGSASPDNMKLRKSGVVSRIFKLEQRESVEEPLDFGDFDFVQTSESAGAGAPLPVSLGEATDLIFVAIDCTAGGGLQHVYIGRATLAESGAVNWLYREELPIHALGGTSTVLSLLDDGPARRFDEAPLPVNHLRLLASEDGFEVGGRHDGAKPEGMTDISGS